MRVAGALVRRWYLNGAKVADHFKGSRGHDV